MRHRPQGTGPAPAKETTMSFKTWIETMMEEKGVDLEQHFEFTVDGTPNIMPYGVVVEAAIAASPAEQKQIKDKLVFIDFKNGDVRHFLRFLGECMAKARVAA